MSILKGAGILLAIILGLGILAGISFAAKAIGFVFGWFLFLAGLVGLIWFGITNCFKKPSP